MKVAGVLLLAALAAAALATDVLVRVELKPDADLGTATAVGATVLDRFDGWLLVRANVAELAALSGRASCRVLDGDIEGKQYVYAMTVAPLDRRRLAACGTVLTEDSEGALLRVNADGLRRLTTMPVELCGISTEPVRPSRVPRPRSIVPSAVSDSLVWQLMARASQDSAEAVLRRLIAFRTRYATTDSCVAASNWFRGRLAGYGCDSTYLDTFQIPGFGPSVNIVGVKRGSVNPNQVYVVCGHVDDTSEEPETFAPGSDDNASGCGLVLEAARMFQGVGFDCTVWFIGFGAEEWGLVGSDSFVRECRERGDTIVLAINHDMNSYGTAGRDSIRVVGKRANPPCSTWVDFYLAQADTFTDLKCRREIVDQQASSDHHSFWKYGYTAIRDRYLDINPEYHTTGDTIGPFQYRWCGTNNLPMYTEVIKATVATVAKLAGAHHTVAVKEPLSPISPVVLTVTPTVGRAPVTLRLSQQPEPDAQIEVFNAVGVLVDALPVSGLTATWQETAAGVYLFRLADRGRVSTAKVVLTD